VSAGAVARLPLLKSLKDLAKSGARLDASIVTTYAFNGLFYEEVLLRAFERAGSRLNVVLVDAAQLGESLADPLRRPVRAGADYLLAPVPHVGAFHPKIIALLSEKQPVLALGSHNATDAGFTHNEELTAFWGAGHVPPAGGPSRGGRNTHCTGWSRNRQRRCRSCRRSRPASAACCPILPPPRTPTHAL